MLPIVVAVAVWATPSFAQQVVCQPIRRGESAAAAARRVTGDSRNTYRASFQILNAASRFVPKSQYERIHAGWRACVVKPAVRRAAVLAPRPEPPKGAAVVDVVRESAAPATRKAPLFVRVDAPSPAPSDAPFPAPSDPLGTAARRDFTWVWLGTAVAAPWLFLQVLDVHRRRTSTTSVRIQHFATRFINEFERPLVQYDGTDRPLQSHVRRGRRGRFDICLAPGSGRRYPNLSDHKRNVEYDVARVMGVLGDDAFVAGELSTQDGWVVVPFQPKTAPKHSTITRTFFS